MLEVDKFVLQMNKMVYWFSLDAILILAQEECIKGWFCVLILHLNYTLNYFG